jgi:hypothetical protein
MRGNGKFLLVFQFCEELVKIALPIREGEKRATSDLADEVFHVWQRIDVSDRFGVESAEVHNHSAFAV